MYKIESIRNIENDSKIYIENENEELNEGNLKFSAGLEVNQKEDSQDEDNQILQFLVSFKTEIFNSNSKPYLYCKCIYEIVLHPDKLIIELLENDDKRETLQFEAYRISEPYYRIDLEKLLSKSLVRSDILPYQFWVNDEFTKDV